MSMWLLLANNMGNNVDPIDIWHWILFIIGFTKNPFVMEKTLYIVVLSADQLKNRVLVYVAQTLTEHVTFMEHNAV